MNEREIGQEDVFLSYFLLFDVADFNKWEQNENNRREKNEKRKYL